MHMLQRLLHLEMIVYASLSVIIPWLVHRINRKLHQLGDPPWKKEQDEEFQKGSQTKSAKGNDI